MTGSRFMLRGAGPLGAKGLAGHPEAYGRSSGVQQGRAGEECLREDVATDSLVDKPWVTISLGAFMGTTAPPPRWAWAPKGGLRAKF